MTLEKAAYIVSLSPGNSDYPQLFRIFLRHGFAALPRYRLFSLTVRTHRKDHPRREKKTSLIRAPEYPNLPSKAQESFLRQLGPSKRRATPSTKDISMNSSSAIRHCFTAALCLLTPGPLPSPRTSVERSRSPAPLRGTGEQGYLSLGHLRRRNGHRLLRREVRSYRRLRPR